MNKEEALKKIEELKEFVKECDKQSISRQVRCEQNNLLYFDDLLFYDGSVLKDSVKDFLDEPDQKTLLLAVGYNGDLPPGLKFELFEHDYTVQLRLVKK